MDSTVPIRMCEPMQRIAIGASQKGTSERGAKEGPLPLPKP